MPFSLSSSFTCLPATLNISRRNASNPTNPYIQLFSNKLTSIPPHRATLSISLRCTNYTNHSSFTCLPATLNVSHRNASNPMDPYMQLFPNKLTIIPPHHRATLSIPLRCSNQSPTLTDDSGVGATTKLKILENVMREIGDSWEYLDLIDALQRLGIYYHFQKEIQLVLQRQYVLFHAAQFHRDTHLHKVSLLFRLLRQQGYPVSADVFKVFMDDKKQFDKELRKDIKGLTSLYEASHLCMEGEDILEEARNFSSNWLNAWVLHVDHQSASFVHNTLAHPHHKSVAQFMMLNYFGDIQCPNKWISILQDVAKLDFHETQCLRKREIGHFFKWWKQTDLARELNFARDQPIKWYIVSLVCLTDMCYSEQRVQLAKSVSFIYLIDDLFDVFGTIDELTLFTEVVCRWDLVGVEKLPNCMQICFKSLFEVTNEISNKIYEEHGWNPIGSLSKAWGKLCKAFLVEAEWLSCGHSPSAEEYLRNGIISTGVHVVLVHVFFLLGQQISKQTAELLEADLDIVSSTATILRLWDDMGSAKDENQEGRDGSYLEYHRKEHPDTSYETTQQHVMWKISEAWKTLNGESLLSNPFPAKFIEASLNIARAVPLAYSYGRNPSFPTFKDLMEQLLFHNVEI